MSFAVVGDGSVIGLGEEVEGSWGDPVAITHWLVHNGQSLGVDAPITKSGRLYSGQDNFHNARTGANLRRTAGGDIRTELAFADKAVLLLLLHAFGEVNTVAAGAPPYNHTFTLKKPGKTGLTIEVIKGFHPDLAELAQTFAGSKVGTLAVDFEPGEYAIVRAGIISKNGSAYAAPSDTPTFTPTELVAGHQFGSLTLGGDTHRLTRFGFSIDRGIDRRPYLGSKDTDEPQITRQAVIKASGRVEWADNNMYADFLNGVQADATVQITGSGNNLITVQMDNAMLNAVSNPTESHGVLGFDFEVDCFADATDRGLKLTVRNDNATAT